MAAGDAAVQNFLLYKVGTLLVISGVLYWFRKSVKYYTQQKVFAWFINKFTARTNRGFFKYKTKIFERVHTYHGHVKKDLTILEIGAGTAANLEFFPVNTKLVCLDPNLHFVGYIRKNLKRHNTVITAEIVQGYAENMPMEDARFDVVVSTLVLCSVSDVQKCLAEIKRVLKPGGVFVFLEHVADQPQSWRRVFQRVMNPLHQILGDGCEVIREIGPYIENAGFSNVNMETFYPSAMPYWIKPCIMGWATK